MEHCSSITVSCVCCNVQMPSAIWETDSTELTQNLLDLYLHHKKFRPENFHEFMSK